MITRRPEHLNAFSYRGPHRYFLTFCTYGKHKAFVDQEPVDVVLSHILRTSQEQGLELTAYCFMPDHVHLLVEGTVPTSDCREFVARAKQFSGFYYTKRFGVRLWQRYSYERVLREHEQTVRVVRYILENPLRAGLVQRVQDYLFLGSSAHTIEQIAEAVQMMPAWRRSG
jgi:putative transposase